MNNNHPTAARRRSLILAVGAILGLASGHASAVLLNFPPTPLFVTNAASPNLMFMVDSSGSMNNVVADAPYTAGAGSGGFTCPAANYIPSTAERPPVGSGNATKALDVMVPASGAPRIAIGNVTTGTLTRDTVYEFGSASGRRCFNPSKDYQFVRLNSEFGTNITHSSTNYRVPSSYSSAQYSGDYLNWYFRTDSVTGVTWNAGQQIKPLPTSVEPSGQVLTRIRIARPAAETILNSLDSRLRVGLSVYNGNNGGRLRVPVADLTSTQRTALTTGANGVANISPGGNTPLAETLSGIGRYFASGYTGNLTLRPENANPVANVTRTVAQALPQNLFNVSGGDPITLSCQQSFAVLVTDGRPSQDQGESGYLAVGSSPNDVMTDYDGDCFGASPACLSHDRKATQTYEDINAGSDYLDDVAQALFDVDLRPDFPNETGDNTQFKNNIRTYMIGFADSEVQDDPLLSRTATQGGGTFEAAANAATLVSSFNNIVTNILSQAASFSAASLNSTSINAGSRLIQASFNSGDWSGALRSIPISDGQGSCSGVALGRLCTESWNAATVLNSATPGNRVILTSTGSAGIPFRWADLSSGQQTLLNYSYNNLNNTATADSRGQERLDYLRGDRSDEGAGNFRTRGNRLGDIVSSDPFFVGPPGATRPIASYAQFRIDNAGRTPMIYVGANDGMLHGFRASDGAELLAYVPSVMFGTAADPKLARMTAQPYTHVFGVDGTPTVGDVQIGSAWRSYLVGSMRLGGQALFALDVTNPAQFTEANAASIVKWEFTDANSGTEGRDLGFTFSQPSLVKMKNNKWAAIVGNGYNSARADGNASTNKQAALFIVFLDGPGGDGTWAEGTEYRRILVGPTGQDNGLGTPAAVDFDRDGLVDYIYAGDLQGKLWQFNVNDPSPANWVAGYADTPVFSAVDGHLGNPQPITARPEVGLNLLTADPDDLIVYFGTGRYLQTSDNTQSGQQTQSFYAIFVNPIATPAPSQTQTTMSPNPLRSDLREQFVLQESGGTRVTSNHALDPDTHEGFFIDLYNGNNDAAANNLGERQISTPVLRNNRVTFSTLIPSESPCDFGGSGWLMSLDARTGGRPSNPVFNLNSDTVIDASDRVLLGSEAVAVSGRQSTGGIPSAPAVLVLNNEYESLFVQSSDGGFLDDECTTNCGEAGGGITPGGRRPGRITWREIPPS